jgi:hypothetical protein
MTNTINNNIVYSVLCTIIDNIIIYKPKIMDAYLGVVMHYINDDFELKSILFDFIPLSGSHTGKKLARSFSSSIIKRGVKQVGAIVCDNASNNNTFMRELESIGSSDEVDPFNNPFDGFDSDANRQRCFAHVVNLASKRFLKVLLGDKLSDKDADVNEQDEESNELREIEAIDTEHDLIESKSIVGRLRKVVKKIRKSTQLQETMDSLCTTHKIPLLSVVLYVETRWNSTYDMAHRCIKLKPALIDICEMRSASLTSFALDDAEWKLVHDIESILMPMKKVTLYCSHEKIPTLAEVVPTYTLLINHFEELRDKDDSSPLLKKACDAAIDKLLE